MTLDRVSNFANIRLLIGSANRGRILENQRKFLKWLKKQGVTVKKGKKHLKLRLNDKRSTIPRSKKIAIGTIYAIKRQLGLKD